MAELVDCHTHTVFSDGESTFEENMKTAVAAGVKTIACTDHWGRPAYFDYAIPEEKLGEYGQAIKDIRTLFPELEIVHGLECDWYPGCDNDVLDFKGDATFLLGSVHNIGELPLDWDGDMRIWENYGADWVWTHYVDCWCKAANAGLFDSMAHPDLPRLFWNKGYAPTIDMDPLFDAMADAVNGTGMRIEVSVAGVRKNLGDYYPFETLLRRFFKAGVPITVGTDSHQSQFIGQGIEELYKHVYEMGYRHVDVPTIDGDWRKVCL